MNQIPRTTFVPAALLAGLSPLVANTLHEDGAREGEQILSEAAAGLSPAGQASIALFLLGFAALVVVLGTMTAVLATRAPTLSGVAAIAGAAAVAIKLSEAQTGMALRETADVVEPGTAQVLVAMDDAGFAVYGFLVSLALGSAALGLLRSGQLPGWLAWWGVVMGGLGVVTAAVGILRPSAYVPLPFVFLLLWLAALGIAGARRPLGRSAPDMAAPVPQ